MLSLQGDSTGIFRQRPLVGAIPGEDKTMSLKEYSESEGSENMAVSLRSHQNEEIQGLMLEASQRPGWPTAA